jgi:hypothetical protein
MDLKEQIAIQKELLDCRKELKEVTEKFICVEKKYQAKLKQNYDMSLYNAFRHGGSSLERIAAAYKTMQNMNEVTPTFSRFRKLGYAGTTISKFFKIHPELKSKGAPRGPAIGSKKKRKEKSDKSSSPSTPKKIKFERVTKEDLDCCRSLIQLGKCTHE